MTLNVAVVGYGYWGSKHVRVLHGIPEVAVTVIDHHDDRRREAVRAFPRAETAASLEEVAAEMDAVIVATPPLSHYELGRTALAHGCHVLIEKPLTTNADEARELIRQAATAGLVLMAGHTFEYNAGIRKLREIIESGELGRTLYIDTARLNLGLYQQDVNVIWDLAPHDISIVNYLLRSAPVEVIANAQAHRGSTQEDVAILQLRYEDPDVTAYVRVSWLDPRKVRRVTVVGDTKMVVNNDLDDDRIRIYDMGVEPGVGEFGEMHQYPLEYRYGDIVSPHVQFEEPLRVENDHFIECIRTGAQPLSDGQAGLRVVEVIEAAQLAVAEGRPVKLSEVAAGRSDL
ncbi:MAG: Gfo/Idh/MocA family oxidoreductase [Acidimicrobiales bacterium]